MILAKLLVFDIDGTLINTRAGRHAFNRALERVFGIRDAAASVPMAGRTDPHIFRDVCHAHGLDPKAFGAWKLEFLADLADAMREDPGHILPGVVDLVGLCSREPGFALALGTGNVEEGARLKLAPHDLNKYFPTGGFGADGDTRAEVIARGIQRAEQLQGARFDSVIVLGDTPMDIACGKENRCVTVGVATGGYHSEDELRACGADLVLPDFSAVDNVMSWLRGL